MTINTPSELPAVEHGIAAGPQPDRRTVQVVRRFDCGRTMVAVREYYPSGRCRSEDLYYVTPIPADFGRAYEWRGIGAKQESHYRLNLREAPGGEEPPVCECIADARGDVTCRHIAATLRLLANGSL